MTLHYQGGATGEVEVMKDGRKWMYFQIKNGRGSKYRLDKQTGEVQIGPYWYTGKNMYVD